MPSHGVRTPVAASMLPVGIGPFQFLITSFLRVGRYDQAAQSGHRDPALAGKPRPAPSNARTVAAQRSNQQGNQALEASGRPLEVSLSLHFVIRGCDRFQTPQAMLPLATYRSKAPMVRPAQIDPEPTYPAHESGHSKRSERQPKLTSSVTAAALVDRAIIESPHPPAGAAIAGLSGRAPLRCS